MKYIILTVCAFAAVVLAAEKKTEKRGLLGLGYGGYGGHDIGLGHGFVSHSVLAEPIVATPILDHGIGYGHGVGHGISLGHSVGLGHGVALGHGLGHGIGLGYGGIAHSAVVASPTIIKAVSTPVIAKTYTVASAPVAVGHGIGLGYSGYDLGLGGYGLGHGGYGLRHGGYSLGHGYGYGKYIH